MHRVHFLLGLIAMAGCDGAAPLDAGVDAAVADARSDARRPPPPYCPNIRPTTSPGVCDEPGDAEVELAIEVVRGRVLFDAGDAATDARGRLVVLAYDQDPRCDTCPKAPPVAVIDVDDARIDAEPSWVQTVRVPRGPVWLFGWVDDDGDTMAGMPRLLDVGDLATAVPQLALACSATSARLTLDRRLGVLTGSLSIDEALATPDRAGDVWLMIYSGGPLAQAALVGATVVRGVDLASPTPYRFESAIDYDGTSTELVPFPATVQLVGIFDADADGELGEPGELLALAAPGAGSGPLLCLDDTRLTFEHDVVFNVMLD
jgi:hypothetical protein